MDGLAPSMVNVRLSAVRKLVTEAQRNGMLEAEAAAALPDVPNPSAERHPSGNWLTREQARELLAVPNRDTLLGKRDYAILPMLVGCGLRRAELASLDVSLLQMRENRWVLADLRGKGGRVRTVAVPLWVKQAINAWQTAAGIEEGRLFRSVRKGGRKIGEDLSDWAVWAVVEQAAREIGVDRFGARPPPHLRQTLPQSRPDSGADQVTARTLVDPNGRTIPRLRAGNRHCGQRQLGALRLSAPLFFRGKQ